MAMFELVGLGNKTSWGKMLVVMEVGFACIGAEALPNGALESYQALRLVHLTLYHLMLVDKKHWRLYLAVFPSLQ